MCSTSLSIFAPDRNYGSRNYLTSKRSERGLERRLAGGRSATFPKSEPCKISPELVVRIRAHPGALATCFRSDRTPPIGRTVLGPDPSPLYPCCAPNPETRRLSTFSRPLRYGIDISLGSPEVLRKPKLPPASSEAPRARVGSEPPVPDPLERWRPL